MAGSISLLISDGESTISPQNITTNTRMLTLCWTNTADIFRFPSDFLHRQDCRLPISVDPVDQALGGNIGAVGHGQGSFDAHHTFKAWPQQYLNLLTNDQGQSLNDEEQRAYQNPEN